MRITVKDIKEGKEGLVWVKGEKGLFLFKDFQGQVGDEIDLQKYEQRQTKTGAKYFYVSKYEIKRERSIENEKQIKEGMEKMGIQVQEKQSKEGKDYKEALQVVSEVEKTINSILLDRQEMIRLALVNAVYGGTMLLVGGTGVGKTMSAELISSAFSDKVYYTQLNYNKELSDVIGYLNLKELRENGVAKFNVERFINADFHIYDEFYNSTGRLRSALNDYILRRQLTVGDSDVIIGKTRAIYLTSNHIDNLRDPRVLAEGGVAIADRVNLVYTVPEVDGSLVEKLLLTTNEGKQFNYKLKQPIGSIEHLEAIKRKAMELKNPEWFAKKIGEFVDLVKASFPESRISVRKALQIADLVKINAVINGRDKILEEDLRAILPHTLFVNQTEKKIKEDVDRIVSTVLNLETSPVAKILLSALNSMNSKVNAVDWYVNQAQNLGLNKDSLVLLKDFVSGLSGGKSKNSVELNYINYVLGDKKGDVIKYVEAGMNGVNEEVVSKVADEVAKITEKELDEMLGGGIKL